MPFGEDGKAHPEDTRYLNIAPMDYLATATRLNPSPKKNPNFKGLYADIEMQHGFKTFIFLPSFN